MNNEYVANIVNEEGNLSGVNIVNAVVYHRNKNSAYILYIWSDTNTIYCIKTITYNYSLPATHYNSMVSIWLSEEFSCERTLEILKG